MKKLAAFPLKVFSRNQLEKIEKAMLRILGEVGIAVKNEELLHVLRKKGFKVNGERVFVERGPVMSFLEDERKRSRSELQKNRDDPSGDEAPFQLYTNDYVQNVHDPATDSIVAFSMESLIEATKLLDVLQDRGIASSPPGLPGEISPSIQPVYQYWVAATYSRQGRRPMDPKTLKSIPYVREMSEVLGHPLRTLDVWVVSPLVLGGESLDAVLQYGDQLDSIGVGNMAGIGSTLPIHVGDAFAVSLAEVIGSTVLLREILTTDLHWHTGFHPTDFQSGAMVIGSPESTLFRLLHDQVDAYFRGLEWNPKMWGSIMSMAKLPGAQACCEKTSMMTLSALFGQRDLYYAGSLALDEVYSNEQLLYDIEIKDHVSRLVQGMEDDCDPARCLSDVQEGIREGSFFGLDTTVETFRETYWDPVLFERNTLGVWKAQGSKSIRERTQKMIRELLMKHEYQLEADLQREIDIIRDRARDEVS